MVKRLRIGIIDVVANTPKASMWARAMRVNLAAIMPQVIAVWCEQEGHEVFLAYYAGHRNMVERLPDDLDILFVGAFTSAAEVAYAVSRYYQSKGTVTVLGGPHARCYPADACKYFDFVLGLTDKDVVKVVLDNHEPHRPRGIQMSAAQQPSELPGVRERWHHIERLLQEAPWVKIVSMIGSLGCPYTCSFCVDSVIPYQPLDFDVIKEDLRFLRTKFDRPIVGWHDPNFGVRFDDYLGAIEEAVPPDSIDFIAESTLSLLSEKNVRRLQKNGFKAVLPGIESWYEMGNKSKTGRAVGQDKLKKVSDHINMILGYLPYVQANFVLGLDCDEGDEPFELTKRFLDRSPGAFPAFSMLTAFGRSAPLNLEYQRQGRVIAFPFHSLNNNGAMNVRPKNYEWTDLYDRMIDLREHAFSPRLIAKRFGTNRGSIPRIMNLLRGASSEGWGRTRYFREVRRRLDTDTSFRGFFEQENSVVPSFFTDRLNASLGPLRALVPESSFEYDAYAYLKSTQAKPAAVAEA